MRDFPVEFTLKATAQQIVKYTTSAYKSKSITQRDISLIIRRNNDIHDRGLFSTPNHSKELKYNQFGKS
jgi:hypothetical protein